MYRLFLVPEAPFFKSFQTSGVSVSRKVELCSVIFSCFPAFSCCLASCYPPSSIPPSTRGKHWCFFPLTILPWLVQPNAVPSVDSQPEWHLPWQRNVAMFEGVPMMRSNAWRIRRFSKLCNLIAEGMQTHIPLNASRRHSAE